MTRHDFTYVFKNGRHYHSPCFHVVVLPTEKHPQSAVVVSKKVYKTAVKRNTLRRRLSAVLRELHTIPHAHRIVIVKPEIKYKTRREASVELRTVLDESGKRDTINESNQ